MQFEPEGALFERPENQERLRSTESLLTAMANEQILEAKAYLCTESHDLMVHLGNVRGIIPREEAAIGIREGTVRDIAIISRVGRPVAFIIQSMREENGRMTAILSRRAAQQRCLQAYIDHLIPGDIIGAKITRLENFGAFLDIGCGIVSLMPIDMMSVSRISHPQQRFHTGQTIRAVVHSHENGRISLSHKELLGTWEENASLYHAGETVHGIVRSLEEYGIFVELTPNLAGLAEKKPGIEPGMAVSVFIKSILPERMKVKLVIIDGFPDEDKPLPFTYRIREGHISCWVYSPACCPRVIETVFDPV